MDKRFFVLIIFLGIILFPGFSNAETLDLQVGASSDDITVYWNGSSWLIYGGAYSFLSSYANSTFYKLGSGARFLNVTIPQGAIINTAYITLTSRYSYWTGAIESAIVGEASSNPTTFSSLLNYQSRRGTVVGGASDNNITSASITWSIPQGGWTIDTGHNSPNIAPVIQEIINRGDWVSGNPLVLFWDDHANKSLNANGNNRDAYSYDSSPAKAPKLHIEYALPGGASDIIPPVRSNAQPTGILPTNTTQTNISLTTDELAVCRYSTVANINYDLMNSNFPSTLSTSHTALITGLVSDTTYNYYIKCSDGSGNKNTNDFLISFSVAAPSAAGWPGWANLNYIYYDPSKDDVTNKFLEQAATELKNNLAQVGKILTIVTVQPVAPAINLRVDAVLPEFSSRGDESFKLFADADGVYITGKTALAARHGTYAFLEKLGFRWFFKSPAWNVIPTSLINLSLNEVQEPYFFWREFGFLTMSVDSSNKTADWSARNRLYGAKNYLNGESYAQIIPKAELSAHPEYFLPQGMTASTWPWQLKADNPDVLARAIQYARARLSASPYQSSGLKDKLVPGTASIIPNDGGISGWAPWNDDQTITDKAFGLANNVAKNIKTDFPDRLITMYAYADYSCIPSINLEPNLLVYITTTFNNCYSPNYQDFAAKPIGDVIAGIKAKGAQVGVYEYVDIWDWFKDRPASLNKVKVIPSYVAAGARAYTGEGGDTWGSKGLLYYTLGKILWDPFQNFDAILTDFYSKAFGPAQSVMKSYYETLGTTAGDVAARFSYLAQAESLVAGNNAYLERIRQLEYYQRFVWFYHTKRLTSLTLNELKSFYTFITKLRDLYILNYGNIYIPFNEQSIRAELKSRGLTDADVDALQNFTTPTAAEAAVWMDEALAAFNLVTPPSPPPPTYTPGDLNKDGKVNIFDVSILLSKWASILAVDLAEADINAGPNNISQGKIDLYDANKLMANWRP